MKKLVVLLLVLCMVCGMGSAEGKQELKIGKAVFDIPAALQLTNENKAKTAYTFTGDDYAVQIVCYYWPDELKSGYTLDMLTPYLDIQYDNFYGLLNTLGTSQQTAKYVLENAELCDLDLPDANLVLLYTQSNAVYAAHYYQDYGFVVIVATTDATLGKNTAFNIIRSFRLEDMTWEDMAAEAAAQKHIVITGSSANIRANADSKSSKLTTAYKGDTFPLLGEEGTWYKIEVNGQTGYVAQGLASIKD